MSRSTRMLVLMVALAVIGTTTPSPGAPLETRNVILITLDGVRTQEIFGGMDPLIVNGGEEHSGIYDLERALDRYWRPTVRARREALMPFFWKELAPQGIVLGNELAGSRMTPVNPHLFSAPGYAEILTGRYQPEVTSNELKRYDHATLLDYVQQALSLDFTEVAMIGSWEGFKYLASNREDAFFTNGGYETVPVEYSTPRMDFLGKLQHSVMALWEVGRSDAISTELALEYLRQHRPRLLYLALGEGDDWTHARRYDRYLDYLHVADSFLSEIWTTLESLDFYRGKTTIVMTTDHGRGQTPEDWIEHEEGIAGSEKIWAAFIGPDTPDLGIASETPTVHQADIAATVLAFFGLAGEEFDPEAGPAIELALTAGTERGTP
jgi:hypothetical protein